MEEICRGDSASEGKATGIVRFLYLDANGGNIDDFEKNEVLVTEMTDIDFLPAMKIAAAIVTRVGGVLSHASIISRELKKPCIVGIKDGSKKLKTGQEIVVDATEGIIYAV